MDNGSSASASNAPLLDVRHLDITYGAALLPFQRKPPAVVRDVSFTLAAHETLALVGESGSGKTTIARAIAGLLAPSRGQILFEKQDISVPIQRRSKALHREIQYIFQNPDSSLNPRHHIADIIGRPLEIFLGLDSIVKRKRVEQLLDAVHLDGSYARRFPMQLSGGERQRVAIAQALAAEPKLALCDEIVSALDVSVQATILDLLKELQAERGIAYLFIAHDLAVVRWLAHHVAVLYSGQMMELGTAAEVFTPPLHPYTEMLLQAVPEPDPRQRLATSDAMGDVGDVGHRTSHSSHSSPPLSESVGAPTNIGCPFASRCPRKVGAICEQVQPPWQTITKTHAIFCHIPANDLIQMQSASVPASV